MDEAWDALHALCLAERGRDADNQSWPLFSSAIGGGHLPLTWTTWNVLWTRVFGVSLAAFRAAAAFWNLVTCLTLFGIGRTVCAIGRGDDETDAASPLSTRVFPWLTAFVACLSPWSFQYSRIAWEGPMAPAFLSLALLCLLQTRKARRLWVALVYCVLSGALAGCAMISYPPLRVAVPPIMFGVVVLLAGTTAKGPARWRLLLRLLPGLICFLAVIAPVVALTLRGENLNRTMSIAIFAPDWLKGNRGPHSTVGFFLVTFIDNLFAHLRPSYLFFFGDGNRRHSAQLVGQLSPVDSLAVGVALATVLWLAWLSAKQVGGRSKVSWPTLNRPEWPLPLIAGFTVLAGAATTVPAALTWDAVPHSLRSIGSWPFVALFSGAVLALAWPRLRWLPATVALTALVYSAAYLPDYFGATYRAIANDSFSVELTEAVEAGQQAQPPRTALESIKPLLPKYFDGMLRYYLMSFDGLSCQRSAEVLEETRRQP